MNSAVSGGGPAAGRAPAKLILMGEHFVVYGAPALAVPVPALAIEATIVPKARSGEDPHRPEPSPDPRSGQQSIDSRSHLEACVDIACRRFGLDPSLHDVRIHSRIPIGAGLGSSAALSVAVGKAAARLAGLTDPDRIESAVRETSLEAERLAHGRPSGIDTEVCLTGRPLLFAKGAPVRPLGLDRASRIGLVIIDTGRSSGTADMVARAARFRQRSKERFAALMHETEAAVLSAAQALLRADTVRLGRLMNDQHRRLVEIGVSSPELEGVVEAALASGAAGAKLSGAGGGGVAAAVCEPSRLGSVRDRLCSSGHTVVAAAEL